MYKKDQVYSVKTAGINNRFLKVLDVTAGRVLLVETDSEFKVTRSDNIILDKEEYHLFDSAATLVYEPKATQEGGSDEVLRDADSDDD